MSDSSVLEKEHDRQVSLEGKKAQIFPITNRSTDVNLFLRDTVGAQGEFETRDPKPSLEWVAIRNSESGIKKDQNLLFIKGVNLTESEWKVMLGCDIDSGVDLSYLKNVTANFCFVNIDDLVEGYDLEDVYDSQVELYRILTSGGLTNGHSLFKGLIGDGMFTSERTEEGGQISLRNDFIDTLKDTGIKDVVIIKAHGAGKGKERLYRDRIIGTHGTTVATVNEVLRSVSETIDAKKGLAVVNVSCSGEIENGGEWTPHLLIGAISKAETTIPVPLINSYSKFIYCESDVNMKQRVSGPAIMVSGSKEQGVSIQKYEKRKKILVAGAELW